MFGKRKDKESQPGKEKIAKGIAAWLLKIQSKSADFLNQKTASLTNRGKKIFLVSICLVFGGMSVYTIVNVFNKGKDYSFKPASITTLKHIDEGDKRETYDMIISDAEFKRIQLFQNYMDSLRISKKGKAIYDSIMLSRPGLMDSIQLFITIYNHQKQ